MKKVISSLLALCLTLSLALVPASALTLEDAKDLLKQVYVDGIPDELLELDSLDAILDALGDPYTVYMTAEQYKAFNEVVNGQEVVGIGAAVELDYNNGYLVLSVLPDSPALEAGILAGDILVAVDGEALTADVDPRVPVAGPEGSQVTVTIRRDGQLMDFTLTRREMKIPIVTYELVGDAGVIDCISFGATTPMLFQEALAELEEDASVWIVDLRSNPGGGSAATALTSSFFTGGGVMLYYRDGAGNYQRNYTAETFPDLTDKSVIVLTSGSSASGAELFTADMRSYKAGIALGQRTFGKGTAQLVFDETNTDIMENGEAMKITAYRFFSPDGATNHIVGVLPTLMISLDNTPAAALLLSSAKPARAQGYWKLELSSHTFYIDGAQAAAEEFKAAFSELLEALPPSAKLYQGSGSQTWNELTPAQAAGATKVSFTPRTFSDTADSAYAREIDTLSVYGMLSGYADGNFHPADSITRAQFCTMTAAALDLPDPENKGTKFTDVPAGSWFAGPVAAMASMGFVSGYSDGRFDPNDTVSYQEMVAILSRVAAWASIEGDAANRDPLLLEESVQFAAFDEWAQIPARNLDSLDVLLEGPAPRDTGTREMAAALLCRLMENTNIIWP